MLKKLFVTAFLASAGAAASGATYVILPEPGTMGSPTVIVDPSDRNNDDVFVCSSDGMGAATACKRMRKKVKRASLDVSRWPAAGKPEVTACA